MSHRNQSIGFYVMVTLIRWLLIAVFEQLIIKVMKHPIEHKMSAVICNHIKKGSITFFALTKKWVIQLHLLNLHMQIHIIKTKTFVKMNLPHSAEFEQYFEFWSLHQNIYNDQNFVDESRRKLDRNWTYKMLSWGLKTQKLFWLILFFIFFCNFHGTSALWLLLICLIIYITWKGVVVYFGVVALTLYFTMS